MIGQLINEQAIIIMITFINFTLARILVFSVHPRNLKNYILKSTNFGGTSGAEGSNVCCVTGDTERSNNFGGRGGTSLSVVTTWSQ